MLGVGGMTHVVATVAGAMRVIEEERAAKGLPPLPPDWLCRERR